MELEKRRRGRIFRSVLVEFACNAVIYLPLMGAKGKLLAGPVVYTVA